jgi:uncharacterized protein YggE
MNNDIGNQIIPYNTMTLTGKGQISVVPDVASIHLGIQSTGENLEEVQSDNSNISQNILQSIKQHGITDIKTFQYLIEKVYEYENDIRVEKGYSVRNIFEIKLTDMNQVGTVIDEAVKNGANVVEFIGFEVSNPDYYYQQALNLAVMNAIQKAQSIAMQLRVRMNSIPIHITENSSLQIPFSNRRNMGEIALATPIEPGQYQIEATVTAEFLY